MLAIIIVLLFIGLISVIIGEVLDLKNYREENFSYKPLIFFISGIMLFALGIFVRYASNF